MTMPFYADDAVTIWHADARMLPLDDATVDLVVTSPPYFGLRSYQDGGGHYAGQIGDERTPAEFVDALVAATAEMVRALKPSGSIWVNLGDKYAGSTNGTGAHRALSRVGGGQAMTTTGAPTKSLLGIPWRYALRCIDDLGLILRAEVIWSKPNGLPESVTDRVRRSHETWFWFQQSGGVEAVAESLPFCALCGRPQDARSTLVKRLQEVDGSVISSDLSDQVGPDQRVQSERAGRTDLDVRRVPGGPSVPVLSEGDPAGVQDGPDLHQNLVAAVEDEHAKVRVPVRGAGQADGALSVDDPGEPSKVCDCVGHPLIIDDEPWIPQSVAAEIMQLVADGECDPQAAADYLSGDYVRNHSVWFHFTVRPRYFSAVDEVREPLTDTSAHAVSRRDRTDKRLQAAGAGMVSAANPLGKLPGSVWDIPTQPLRVPDHLGIDHFAAFPMEWPRRIIRGWSPRGVCTACGEGRRPVVSSPPKSSSWTDHSQDDHAGRSSNGSARNDAYREKLKQGAGTSIVGEACACPEPTAPTRPAVVLDPFGGTGTTGLVAAALGRRAHLVDLSEDYCRLARWRVTDPGELARALEVEKPPPAPEGMDSLLDLIELLD